MNVIRVVAPNPGLFTGAGSNTWLLESCGCVAVIDPGPVCEEHRRAVVSAAEGFVPAAVLVTHCHPDHVGLANDLAAVWGVPAMGASPGPGFKPDRLLADGDVVRVGDIPIEVISTPGHTAHHLCFRAGPALFTGDHIMGGTSVIVAHMAEYLDSLERIRGIGVEMLYPGHGDPMEDPDEVIDWYVEHRLERERQILGAIGGGAGSVGAIVEECYQDVDSALHLLAARSVGAHLRKLAAEGVVELPQGSEDWLAPVVVPAGHAEEA